jgi:ATP-dependent Clp protease, protease subunit
MPLVPAVTELIIAELLYLNYESTTDPITMYINSSGTTTADGQQVGFETEAFAIADVMKVCPCFCCCFPFYSPFCIDH